MTETLSDSVRVPRCHCNYSQHCHLQSLMPNIFLHYSQKDVGLGILIRVEKNGDRDCVTCPKSQRGHGRAWIWLHSFPHMLPIGSAYVPQHRRRGFHTDTAPGTTAKLAKTFGLHRPQASHAPQGLALISLMLGILSALLELYKDTLRPCVMKRVGGEQQCREEDGESRNTCRKCSLRSQTSTKFSLGISRFVDI